MKRLYFLVPKIDMAKKIVDELLLQRIDINHIHVLSKRGTLMDNLPEASYLQKSDFVPALEQGLLTGGFTGFVAGVVALTLTGESLLSGGALLVATLVGAVFGAFVSSLLGSSVGNRQIRQFDEAINEKGAFLMMVDIPRERIAEIEQAILKQNPGAKSEGTEPTIPAFP
ncbi:MAG: DUF1269 domain-containing protein [Gallionellales bacterium 35-53-114]|jgi:hypothetical protein|nr:MAG: DUF1269 domain-containing protein [Gallionellales bacterium 35-53-114]OYZ65222.1 MAG: DUF1269 domain-containing protein [Gallionellales bacterium 24-53-125]OZB08128.1 MAG: DUF1269 domain-containing protein [Gallionellales bacterium 39-52-133]HQS58051.1 DUF1269 domain-containing protein [Gallionellaceae bacterium]HQS73606.1 DUF1269 domain-containing protein [Gallionellaceae bacterium]